MAASRTAAWVIVSAGLLGGLTTWLPRGPSTRPAQAPTTTRVVRRPALSFRVDATPAEVREFLDRVTEKIPDHGAGVAGYRFRDWDQPGKPTHEALGLKAIAGVDPDALIARVKDVNAYCGRIDHVEACRAVPDPAFMPPHHVRFYQQIRVGKVVDIQQELALIDAGTIKGYRVACWYLLKDPTNALDRAAGARSEYNVGAWLAAPGVVGYALSTWPRRDDVNLIQWLSLTSGANTVASRIVEANIDAMAAWAKDRGTDSSPE